MLGQLYASNGVPASVSVAPSADMITVGLVLNRANDPTALLESSWGVREAALANQSAVFATYGALPTTFGATLAATEAAIGPGGAASFQAASDAGYISSAADRTIWLTLNATQFGNLFGTQLLSVAVHTPLGNYTQLAWGGDLNLAPAIAANVGGLWFENGAAITNPAVLDSHGVTLPAGPLGIGNSSTSVVSATPAAIAANYDFPLGNGGATGPIALVETNVPSQAALFAALNQYRVALGEAPMSPAQFQVLSGSNGPGTPNGEITLDVSVLASAAPNSTQLLYSFGEGSPYNAYQQAFFDFTHNPAVVSSSYGSGGQPTANSPFQWAFQQLFVDAALRNISVMIAAGDQGSSGAIANGVANAFNSQSPLWALAVGGTSIANLHSALADPTLSIWSASRCRTTPRPCFPWWRPGSRPCRRISSTRRRRRRRPSWTGCSRASGKAWSCSPRRTACRRPSAPTRPARAAWRPACRCRSTRASSASTRPARPAADAACPTSRRCRMAIPSMPR